MDMAVTTQKTISSHHFLHGKVLFVLSVYSQFKDSAKRYVEYNLANRGWLAKTVCSNSESTTISLKNPPGKILWELIFSSLQSILGASKLIF